MTQNRSTAVMQRRGKAPNALDYFPTPPWATRALCEWLIAQGHDLSVMNAWEPACGENHMVDPLQEYFKQVHATDVHDYCGNELYDFPLIARVDTRRADFVITNPPFALAEAFIEAAMVVSGSGFAMLLRTAFLEGQGRYETLFSVNPPSHVLQFSERVLMLRDRLVKTGAIDPVSGKEVTSATAYFWLVWLPDYQGTSTEWIAPCRKKLEKPGDYPVYPAAEFVHPDDLLSGVAQ